MFERRKQSVLAVPQCWVDPMERLVMLLPDRASFVNSWCGGTPAEPVKGIDQFWSCDNIVKETLWNRSEKFDHLTYKYRYVLQGCGIIKIWPRTVHKKMYMGLCDIYQGRIDMIIYQIYQLVGRFPAKFVSSRISLNIFFHMIGNKSFHFIFWEGGLYL